MATPEEIEAGFVDLIGRLVPLGEQLLIRLAECRAFMDHYIEVDPVGDHLLEAQKAMEQAMELVPVLDKEIESTAPDIISDLPYPAHFALRMYTDNIAHDFGATYARLAEIFGNRSEG